ncbi:MAG: cytochrome c oxidase subunit II [Planctomycetes bacterium]|nr:cytochrome c oxidase subunit II [Planctomycetota bacterium]
MPETHDPPIDRSFRLFPEQASSVAGEVDAVYFFLLAVAAFFTVLIFVLIVYFALRYRRGANVRRGHGGHTNYTLEVAWCLVPFGLTMVMFFWGAKVYYRINLPPAEAAEVYVLAKQWMWKFQHPEGKREIDRLHVPLGRPIRLKMISEDAIHSFYVPAFRVKNDVLPSRYTTVWFEPTKPGAYHLFCAEYCGTGHSKMVGKVVVLRPAEYADWLAGRTDEPLAEAGRRMFEGFGCHTCHDPGPSQRCPPLEGLYGSQVPLAEGGFVEADEDYIRESILDPRAKVRAGYRPIMPTFEEQIDDEEQMILLIEYIKSLSRQRPRGAQLRSMENADEAAPQDPLPPPGVRPPMDDMPE